VACSTTDDDYNDDDDLHGPRFLQVIICYCSSKWAVQLFREVFHLDVSFIGWFRAIRVLFCFLESS
jgi:hypothetical protein